MALRFNTGTNTVSFASEGIFAANALTKIGGQPEIVLKTTETVAGWTGFIAALFGNQQVVEGSTNLANSTNLGAKAICVTGAMSALGSAVQSFYKMTMSIFALEEGKDGAVRDIAMQATEGVGGLASAAAKAGEFAQFLMKTDVIEANGMLLASSVQGFKIGADIVGIATVTNGIFDVVDSHMKMAGDDSVEQGAKDILMMKTHETWVGMIKHVSALALHVLSFLGIVLGIAFANPILLVIGTVVLVSSIALFFLADTRKAMENADVLQQINTALSTG